MLSKSHCYSHFGDSGLFYVEVVCNFRRNRGMQNLVCYGDNTAIKISSTYAKHLTNVVFFGGLG